MNAEAKYYAGGGLAGAPDPVGRDARAGDYRPPGWDRYTFDRRAKRSEPRYYAIGTTTSPASTSTSQASDAVGRVDVGHHLRRSRRCRAASPALLTVDATVTDIDRQTIRASSRADRRPPATLLRRPAPEARDVATRSKSSSPTSMATPLPACRSTSTIEGVLGSERFRDDAEVIDTQHCKVTSASEPVTCEFKRKDIQTAYTAIARIADARGPHERGAVLHPVVDERRRAISRSSPIKKSYKPGRRREARDSLEGRARDGGRVVRTPGRDHPEARRADEAERDGRAADRGRRIVQNVHVDRRSRRRSAGTDERQRPAVARAISSASSTSPVDVESARLVMRRARRSRSSSRARTRRSRSRSSTTTSRWPVPRSR